MKHKRLLSVFLALLVSVNLLVVPATAADSSETFTQQNEFLTDDFLSLYSHSDGALAYDVKDQILSFFLENSDIFIEDLMRLNDEDLKYSIIISLISSAYYSSNYDQFIENLSNITDESKKQLKTEIQNYAAEYVTQEAEWLEYYNDWMDNFRSEEGLFDSEMLLNSIKSQDDLYTFDGEYCNHLYNLYLLDTNLFVQTISDLPTDTIDKISAQIAYAKLNTTNDVSQYTDIASGQTLSPEKLSYNSINTLNLLEAAEKDPEEAIQTVLQEENLDIAEVFSQSTISSQSSKQALNPSYIQSITYNPSKIYVGQVETCTISLSSLAANSRYTVEIWGQHDGETSTWKKGSTSITTNSSGKATAQIDLTFSNPGNIWTTVKVYKGSTRIAERTGKYTDTVVGRWSIKLPLSSNHTGTLRMYDANGVQVHYCAALGKSVDGYHYSKYYGNTPPGDYYGSPGGPSTDTAAYGPNKFVRLSPNRDKGYENLYVARYEGEPGYTRSGLLIHGGRSQQALQATNGCVRVFDADAKKLTDLMSSYTSSGYDSQGYVSITR